MEISTKSVLEDAIRLAGPRIGRKAVALKSSVPQNLRHSKQLQGLLVDLRAAVYDYDEEPDVNSVVEILSQMALVQI